MLVYLDLNCFNRPFDDQNQPRIVQETAAIFAVLQRVVDGIDRLAWSAVDAAHVACAEAAACDRFLTCDDEVVRKAARLSLRLRVLNPLTYLQEMP